MLFEESFDYGSASVYYIKVNFKSFFLPSDYILSV